ncbi:MAG: DUF488 family protein [Malacoplasma sp.]
MAPTYKILMSYKENNDIESYIKNYNENILNNLSVKDVLYDLIGILHVENINICLMCYEKPSKFCHRQLVSKWLNDNGIECKEYNFTKKEINYDIKERN